MRFHVITIFPEMIEAGVRYGVVGQALKEGKISVGTLSPRAFTTNVHQTVDDRPFGGGDGMVMMAEPLTLALSKIQETTDAGASPRARVLHFSPRGRPLTDHLVRELVQCEELILVASRYGGVDQRFLNQCVDEEISVGDYVLSGGELPALILIDAVSRHLPGVLGNEASAEDESFAAGLLEQPQFTRPREWRGEAVPSVLLGGDHAKIATWKKAVSILVTADRRPDLLEKSLTGDANESPVLVGRDLGSALDALDGMSAEDRRLCGLNEPMKVRACLLELLARFPAPLSARRRRSRAGKGDKADGTSGASGASQGEESGET